MGKLTDIISDLYDRMRRYVSITALTGGESQVDGAVITAAGTGYTTAPTVSFSGGGGTGAAATAEISNGTVIGITITAAGSGYTSAPTISFSGGGGSGAAATSVLAPLQVDAIATTAVDVGIVIMIAVSNDVYFYQLQAGTDAESSPTIIRPDDYASSTNEKIWRRIDPFGLDSFKLNSVSATGSTTAIDLDNGSAIAVDLQADTELQFSNVNEGFEYVMVITQDGTGGWLPTLDGTTGESKAGNGDLNVDLTATTGITVFYGVGVSASKIRWSRDPDHIVTVPKSATGTSVELSLIPGKTHVVDLQSDTTISAANIVAGAGYVIQLEDDGSGPYTVNFDSTDFEFEETPRNVSLAASGTTVFYGVAISASKIRLFRDPNRALSYLMSAVNAIQRTGGVYLNGASGTRIGATLTGYTAGTDDFSLRIKFKCPTSAPANEYGLVGIGASSTLAGGANGCHLYLKADGSIEYKQFDSPTSDSALVNYPSFISQYGGKVVDVVFVRDAENLDGRLYVNGVEVLTTKTLGGSGTWADSITSTYLVVGVTGNAAYVLAGDIHAIQVFNMALTVSQIQEIHRSGIPFDLVGASPTELVTDSDDRNFATSGHNWVARGTGAGIAYDAGNQELDVTVGNADTGTALSTVNLADSPLIVGRRYRLGVTISNLSSGVVDVVDDVKNLNLSPDNGTTFPFNDIVDGVHSAEFVGRSSSGVDQGGLRLKGSVAGSTFSVDDVTLTRIGCVLDLDLTAPGRFFPDRSGNNFHGEGTSGVYNLVGQIDRIRTVTYASSITIDFNNYRGQTIKISLTGNLTLATSNIKIGDEVTIILVDDGSGRTLTLPSWKAMGAALPTALTASKTTMLTLKATSTADSGILAFASEEV